MRRLVPVKKALGLEAGLYFVFAYVSCEMLEGVILVMGTRCWIMQYVSGRTPFLPGKGKYVAGFLCIVGLVVDKQP